jgi:hypothetical protein
MYQNKSVKQAVETIINRELESGRLTQESLLRPRAYGQCNDDAMFIMGLVIHSKMTREDVREETILRYVRQYKVKLKRKIAYQTQSSPVVSTSQA